MCRALGSSRTREKEPCDRVLSLPCGFHKVRLAVQIENARGAVVLLSLLSNVASL